LGWNRDRVQLGLHERRSGMICVDNYRARGRRKSEAVLMNLEIDIRRLVDVHAQADPKFQSTFLYVRISAREELEPYLPFWQRSETLPKWGITILPA
jgi:hypothetical protein